MQKISTVKAREKKIFKEQLTVGLRPTGTQRKSLNHEWGWKGGDRGGLAERDKRRNALLWTDLLIAGVEKNNVTAR